MDRSFTGVKWRQLRTTERPQASESENFSLCEVTIGCYAGTTGVVSREVVEWYLEETKH